MKLNFNLSRDELRMQFYDQKDYLIPFFAIAMSFLLFFIFIMPQLLSFPSRKTEVDAENVKLDQIKDAEKVLSTANDSLIDTQLEVVSRTLPVTKSFEEILNGIIAAANLSNTQLVSYQYEDQNSVIAEPGKYSSIDFEVSISGDVNQTIQFINQLYKTYPISDVIEINSVSGASTLFIKFYYKTIAPSGQEGEVLVRSMSDAEKKVLADITKWDSAEGGEEIIVASTSGETRTSPF